MKGKVIYMTESDGWYCPHGSHWGIDWGTTVPTTAKTSFATKEEAEEYLRFHNDQKFWKQYEADIIKIAKRYGVYAYVFGDSLTSEEYNLWMFNRSSLPDSEGFEIFSWDGFNECYRALLTEMFETWKECQIV